MEVWSKGTQIHAWTPAEARTTQEQFPVKKVWSRSCEQYHESIYYSKRISNHENIIFIREIKDWIPYAIMWIIHFLFRCCKSVHETNGRSLKCIDNWNQYQKGEAPIVVVLVRFSINDLAHLRGVHFQLSHRHSIKFSICLFFLIFNVIRIEIVKGHFIFTLSPLERLFPLIGIRRSLFWFLWGRWINLNIIHSLINHCGVDSWISRH